MRGALKAQIGIVARERTEKIYDSSHVKNIYNNNNNNNGRLELIFLQKHEGFFLSVPKFLSEDLKFLIFCQILQILSVWCYIFLTILRFFCFWNAKVNEIFVIWTQIIFKILQTGTFFSQLKQEAIKDIVFFF